LNRKQDETVLAAREPQRALQDIEFIKQLIAKNQRKLDQSPPFLLIWGAYMTAGFIGMHFNHTEWPMWFWPIGSIVGGILTAVVGIRQNRKTPVREGGSYGWMFWLPFLMLLLSGTFMIATGIVKLEYISLFWLMLIGIAYVAMAPLLGKGPVFLGCWFIILAVITRLFLMDYQFLVMGLLGGGSFFVTALLLDRRRKKHG